MTTVAQTSAVEPAAPPSGERVTQLRVLRSEWTKLWTLRSTRWSLLAAFVSMAGLAPLIAAAQMSRGDRLDVHERLTYDSVNTGVGG